MLSSLLNNVGDNDSIEGEHPTDYKRPGGRRSSFSLRRGEYVFSWWHVPLILAILFPYISIFVLFGVVSEQGKNSGDNYYTTQNIALTTTFGQSIPSNAIGQVLSFDNNGNLQVGAGSTLYRNIVNINNANCPSYLSMDAINSQLYLFSYANKNSYTATLNVAQLTTTSTASIKQSLSVSYFIYELVTLSSSNGLFVAICQDFDQTTGYAYIISGKVDTMTGQITLSTNKKEYASIYSVAPQIIRLTDSSFAIAYYNINPSLATTAYGRIDPTTYDITLSEGVFFANDSRNSTFFQLAPLTDSQYMVLYYNSPYEDNDYQPGQLHSRLATVSGSDDANTAVISLTNITALETSALIYSFAATSLSNSTVAVAYLDANQNNAVKTQIIKVESYLPNQIIYGASWTVNTGTAYEILDTGLLDIDITKVSENNEFMVLYSDLSNSGAILATTGKLTETNELIRTSPDYLIRNPTNQIETVYTWGAISSGLQESQNSQTTILTMQSNGDCSTSASTSFGLLEKLPGPVGIVSTMVDSNSLGVAVSGSVSGLSGLVPGKVYYGSTNGELVASTSYVGQNNHYSANSKSDLYYIYDSQQNAYISLDSKVGIATGTDTLYIDTSNA